MDDAETTTACILSDCASTDDLKHYLMKHATIVQQLVCRLGKEINQSETGIRALYDTWADMAVEQFAPSRQFPGTTLH
jgi:hypothetical protein